MTACRVSTEELAHDTGTMMAAQLSYYRNELKHLVYEGYVLLDRNLKIDPVVNSIIGIIADAVTEGTEYDKAVIGSIDWYLDNHLDNVVDLVEG
jgi:hypothetical protein